METSSRSGTGLEVGHEAGRRNSFSEVLVLALIGLLLVAWVALIVVGAVVKGLLWLVVVGVVLFLATAAFGWVKKKADHHA